MTVKASRRTNRQENTSGSVITSMALDWMTIRSSVERDPDVVYLNTGTSGLVSKGVNQRAMELRTSLHRNPTDTVWRSFAEELWTSRSRLANHLGTPPDRLIFFTNISHAINTFCLSVDLPPGSQILMTDHEYGAMRFAWERSASRRGWTVQTATLPIGEEDPDAYVQAVFRHVQPSTRLLYVSHVLYSTGLVMPLQRIADEAAERGILVFVDGAHAPGMLPLPMQSLRVPFYAANLHKWFMAPVGAAFLHVAEGMEHHLAPWQVSWAWHDDRSRPNERNEFGSTPWIRQFEMEGTRDITPWRVVHLCCDFLESIGPSAITARHHELSQYVRQCIPPTSSMRLVTPENDLLRGGLTAYQLPRGYDGHALRSRLWNEDRIEINVVELNGVQYLRISTHVYNVEEEIDFLAQSIARRW